MEEGCPKRIALDHDDHCAKHVGRLPASAPRFPEGPS